MNMTAPTDQHDKNKRHLYGRKHGTYMHSAHFGADQISAFYALLDLLGVVEGHRDVCDLVLRADLAEVRDQLLLAALLGQVRHRHRKHRRVHCTIKMEKYGQI